MMERGTAPLAALAEALAGRHGTAGPARTVPRPAGAPVPALLAAMLDRVSDGVLACDADGCILYANRAAGRLFEAAPAGLVGRHWSELVSTGGCMAVIRAVTRQMRRIGRPAAEPPQPLRIVAEGRRGPALFPLELHLDAARTDGDPVWIAALHDLTERRQMERALAQTARLAVLGEVAAALAHELKQPIQAISIFTGLLLSRFGKGGLQHADSRTYLGHVAEQTQALANLAERMGRFGQADALRPQNFDPAGAILAALDLAAGPCAAVSIELAASVPEGGSLVRGHPIRFEQVVMSLVLNARDAIQAERQRRGALFAGRISVALARRHDRVLVTVADNGGPIPEPARADLFAPFTEPAPRAGLGLATCALIVGEMGGTIEARDGAEGAVFEIALPALKLI
ncbi:MAG TPA: ATP-binding protein [Alphaproteobacteria bacterium]|nr:ATP-binding protein [Alphaproteobacteria bacterium]